MGAKLFQTSIENLGIYLKNKSPFCRKTFLKTLKVSWNSSYFRQIFVKCSSFIKYSKCKESLFILQLFRRKLFYIFITFYLCETSEWNVMIFKDSFSQYLEQFFFHIYIYTDLKFL